MPLNVARHLPARRRENSGLAGMATELNSKSLSDEPDAMILRRWNNSSAFREPDVEDIGRPSARQP